MRFLPVVSDQGFPGEKQGTAQLLTEKGLGRMLILQDYSDSRFIVWRLRKNKIQGLTKNLR